MDEIKSVDEIRKRGLATKGKEASLYTENGKFYIDTGHGKKIIQNYENIVPDKTTFTCYDGGAFEFGMTELGLPVKIDLRSGATSAGYPLDYKNYIHIEELELCKPFPHKNLELFDNSKKMPDVVQQHVYVKELKHKHDDANPVSEEESEMLKKIMIAVGEKQNEL